MHPDYEPEEPRDQMLASQMNATLNEAAERVTFHRAELERWERVGRAAQAAMDQIQAASPVAKMPADGFLSKGVPAQSNY